MSILLNPTSSEPRQRLQRSASLVSFRRPTHGFTLEGSVDEEPEMEEEQEVSKRVQANETTPAPFSDGVTPNKGKKSKWRASLKGALSNLKQQHETHNRRASAPAALATYAEQRERERRELVDAETERAAEAARGVRRPNLVRFMAVDQDISARLAAMHAAETNAARVKFQASSHPTESFVDRPPPPRSPLKKFFTSAAPRLVNRWKKSDPSSSRGLPNDEDMEMILLHDNFKATQTNKKIIDSKVKAVNATSELTQEEAIWQEYRHRVMADNFIF